VLLPGVSFVEKTGTYTSTERRVQMLHQAVTPRGEAARTGKSISDLARRIINLGGRRIYPTLGPDGTIPARGNHD
jgi:predicted molibdopterin-dependent oxidoreductase YjgC